MFQRHVNLIPLSTVFIHLFTLVNSFDVGNLTVDVVGKDVQANFCPKFQYASRVEFARLDNNKYNITVECQSFVPLAAAITGLDECRLKYPFPLNPAYPLLWNDYFRQCRCDEYLAGVKLYTAGWNGTWTTESGNETQIIQLQCCLSNNKEQWPPSCVYSGMESLMSPWNVSSVGVRDTERIPGRNYAIQALMIRGHYINAKICDYNILTIPYTLPTIGIRSCWSGVDWECVDNGDQSGVCYDDISSMYGWHESSLAYNNINEVVSFQPGPNNKRQFQMCRSGYRMHSITRTATTVQNASKEYSFDVSCTPMASRSCYCLWMESCPRELYFGTFASWYVAGIRTYKNDSWSTVNQRVEVLCCQSGSMAIQSCRIENLDDNQTTVNVKDQFYPFPLKNQTTLNIIRNVDSSYLSGVLNMRFNICSVIYHYDWCYNDPCYWCRTRAYRDGVFIGAGGFWSAYGASGGTALSSSSSGGSSANGGFANGGATLNSGFSSSDGSSVNGGSLSNTGLGGGLSVDSKVNGGPSVNSGLGGGSLEGSNVNGGSSGGSNSGFNGGPPDGNAPISGLSSMNGIGRGSSANGGFIDGSSGGSISNNGGLQGSSMNGAFEGGSTGSDGSSSDYYSDYGDDSVNAMSNNGIALLNGGSSFGSFQNGGGFLGADYNSFNSFQPGGFAGNSFQSGGFNGGGFNGGGFGMQSFGTSAILPLASLALFPALYNGGYSYHQYNPSSWQSWNGWSSWSGGVTNGGSCSRWYGSPWNGGYSRWRGHQVYSQSNSNSQSFTNSQSNSNAQSSINSQSNSNSQSFSNRHSDSAEEEREWRKWRDSAVSKSRSSQFSQSLNGNVQTSNNGNGMHNGMHNGMQNGNSNGMQNGNRVPNGNNGQNSNGGGIQTGNGILHHPHIRREHPLIGSGVQSGNQNVNAGAGAKTNTGGSANANAHSNANANANANAKSNANVGANAGANANANSASKGANGVDSSSSKTSTSKSSSADNGQGVSKNGEGFGHIHHQGEQNNGANSNSNSNSNSNIGQQNGQSSNKAGSQSSKAGGQSVSKEKTGGNGFGNKRGSGEKAKAKGTSKESQNSRGSEKVGGGFGQHNHENGGGQGTNEPDKNHQGQGFGNHQTGVTNAGPPLPVQQAAGNGGTEKGGSGFGHHNHENGGGQGTNEPDKNHQGQGFGNHQTGVTNAGPPLPVQQAAGNGGTEKGGSGFGHHNHENGGGQGTNEPDRNHQGQGFGNHQTGVTNVGPPLPVQQAAGNGGTEKGGSGFGHHNHENSGIQGNNAPNWNQKGQGFGNHETSDQNGQKENKMFTSGPQLPAQPSGNRFGQHHNHEETDNHQNGQGFGKHTGNVGNEIAHVPVQSAIGPGFGHNNNEHHNNEQNAGWPFGEHGAAKTGNQGNSGGLGGNRPFVQPQVNPNPFNPPVVQPGLEHHHHQDMGRNPNPIAAPHMPPVQPMPVKPVQPMPVHVQAIQPHTAPIAPVAHAEHHAHG